MCHGAIDILLPPISIYLVVPSRRPFKTNKTKKFSYLWKIQFLLSTLFSFFFFSLDLLCRRGCYFLDMSPWCHARDSQWCYSGWIFGLGVCFFSVGELSLIRVKVNGDGILSTQNKVSCFCQGALATVSFLK